MNKTSEKIQVENLIGLGGFLIIKLTCGFYKKKWAKKGNFYLFIYFLLLLDESSIYLFICHMDPRRPHPP